MLTAFVKGFFAVFRDIFDGWTIVDAEKLGEFCAVMTISTMVLCCIVAITYMLRGFIA